ncbi:MAG: undecaprenyl/decaprenyl-phosphate alpha-N-acetylglucosaminyl 1-phosphate transferase [Verrucomicrobiaceae bacterium]|nr:undecaprenyl/decaprenyl-phosphate alpha-N-acetylglucosaminyl 1-phosphate transferase [Verrucomicrobiaceae bacterium]
MFLTDAITPSLPLSPQAGPVAAIEVGEMLSAQGTGLLHRAGVLSCLLALGILIAFATIKLTLRCWTLSKGVDHSDGGHRKRQAAPVLRVGGLALYAVFGVACLMTFFLIRSPGSEGVVNLLPLPSFFLLGSAMFWMGFMDDLYGASAVLKLLVQVLVGVGAWFSGMSIDMVTQPFQQVSLDTGGFSLVLTVFWFVVIPNLFNLTDGMDGLAGGLGLFLAVLLSAMAYTMGNGSILLICVMMIGALLAFLRFNFPPARIYMGDGGAYLIGYFVASAALVTSNKGTVTSVILAVVVALGFPILDTAVAMVRRGLSGMPVMSPDALHLHHRLQVVGLSKRKLLFLVYAAFATLSVMGFAVYFSPNYALPIVAVVLFVSSFVVLRHLGFPSDFKSVKDCMRGMLEARKHVRYAYAISQVLSQDLDRFEDPSRFWEELKAALSKLHILLPFDLLEEGEAASAREDDVLVYRLNDSLVWELRCPSPLSSRQWVRVVRCFHSVVVAAVAKWGHVPGELGIRTCQIPPDPDTSSHFPLVKGFV